MQSISIVVTRVAVGATLAFASACEMHDTASREVASEVAALETTSSASQAGSTPSGKSTADSVAPNTSPVTNQGDGTAVGAAAANPATPAATPTDGQPASTARCLTGREPYGPVPDNRPALDEKVRVSPAEKQAHKQREMDKASSTPATASTASVVPPTPSAERLRAERDYLSRSVSVTDPDEQTKLKQQLLGE